MRKAKSSKVRCHDLSYVRDEAGTKRGRSLLGAVTGTMESHLDDHALHPLLPRKFETEHRGDRMGPVQSWKIFDTIPPKEKVTNRNADL